MGGKRRVSSDQTVLMLQDDRHVGWLASALLPRPLTCYGCDFRCADVCVA